MGHLKLLQYIVSKGAPDVQLQEGMCLDACRMGHLHIVKYILSLGRSGIDIHAYCDLGLKLACWNGHLELMQYLISLGGFDIYRETSLMFGLDCFSIAYHVDIMRYLTCINKRCIVSPGYEDVKLQIKQEILCLNKLELIEDLHKEVLRYLGVLYIF